MYLDWMNEWRQRADGVWERRLGSPVPPTSTCPVTPAANEFMPDDSGGDVTGQRSRRESQAKKPDPNSQAELPDFDPPARLRREVDGSD